MNIIFFRSFFNYLSYSCGIMIDITPKSSALCMWLQHYIYVTLNHKTYFESEQFKKIDTSKPLTNVVNNIKKLKMHFNDKCFNMLGICYTHYSDVIMSSMGSQITGVSIVCPTVCPGADKKNLKVPRHWPLWGEFTGDRWIPRAKDQ